MVRSPYSLMKRSVLSCVLVGAVWGTAIADDTKAKLRARAKRRGRSLEAELRTILDFAANENAAVAGAKPWYDAAGILDDETFALIEERRRIRYEPFEYEE